MRKWSTSLVILCLAGEVMAETLEMAPSPGPIRVTELNIQPAPKEDSWFSPSIGAVMANRSCSAYAGLSLAGHNDRKFFYGLALSPFFENFTEVHLYGMHVGWDSALTRLYGMQGALFACTSYQAGVQTAAFALSNRIDGAQVALIAAIADRVNGVQVSIFSTEADNCDGVQVSAVNQLDNSDALQVGCYNFCSEGGVQLGIFNWSEDGSGQFGLVNWQKQSGWQFGLANYAPNAWIPFLPLFNYAPEPEPETN